VRHFFENSLSKSLIDDESADAPLVAREAGVK